jgi:hypothetical protein
MTAFHTIVVDTLCRREQNNVMEVLKMHEVEEGRSDLRPEHE